MLYVKALIVFAFGGVATQILERDPTPTAAGGIPKPLGGTQDTAYTDTRQQDSPPASTIPHADVRTTSSGGLQTHYY
jgi:hypothetical protein